MNQQTAMTRPTWQFRDRHLNFWKEKDITVLICQRKTKDLVQLCLESLLRFYPDIPIVLVDGDSRDNSTTYLRYMQAMNPQNITLWERPLNNGSKHSSHGVTMDEAIRQYVKTKWVLLLDSDTIVERGGWIEEMLKRVNEKEKIYAIGSLMLVSRRNDACGGPDDDNDVLRYAHPSCSLYNAQRYVDMPPFCDHGAPCCYNMKAAEEMGLEVEHYPVEEYVSHLSGASWCEPSTIWPNDHNVFKRPFLSFIVNPVVNQVDRSISKQAFTDHDFEIIPLAPLEHHQVTLHEYNLNIDTSKNPTYPIRYRVNGDYVCDITNWLGEIQPEFVNAVRLVAIGNPDSDEIVVGGLICRKRQYWQREMIKIIE